MINYFKSKHSYGKKSFLFRLKWCGRTDGSSQDWAPVNYILFNILMTMSFFPETLLLSPRMDSIPTTMALFRSVNFFLSEHLMVTNTQLFSSSGSFKRKSCIYFWWFSGPAPPLSHYSIFIYFKIKESGKPQIREVLQVSCNPWFLGLVLISEHS